MVFPKVTGSNDVPLGKIRTFGRPQAFNPQQPNEDYIENENNNKRSDENANNDKEDDSKRRKTRWGENSVKVNVAGLPTTLPIGLTKDQVDSYVLNLRIEEISLQLRMSKFMPPERFSRSPSPEPIYGPDGKRINTREYRYRKKLEKERHDLVDEGKRRFPDFKPPADYTKKVHKNTEKVWIPAKEYPEVNFIGQLLGPRGNTLKKMESESGAKISIRGKGSVKEGKRQEGISIPGEEEDLHCLVTADSEEKVKKAVKAIEKIIELAASVPEDQNQLKREQLRALAALNGTLREDDAIICTNCGATGHRKGECPDQKNFTMSIVCRICGGVGHTASDCIQRNNRDMVAAAKQREQQFNNEYMNLMVELGETSNETSGKSSAKPFSSGDVEGGAPGSAIPAAPGSTASTGHYGPSSASISSAPPPWASAASSVPGTTPPGNKSDNSAPWAKQSSSFSSNPWNTPAPPPPGMGFSQNNNARMMGRPPQNPPLQPYYGGYNPYAYGAGMQQPAPPPGYGMPPPPSEHPPPPPSN